MSSDAVVPMVAEAATQRRGLAVVSLGHFSVDLCQGVLPLMLPLLQTRLRLDYAATALILTMAYVTSSIVQPLFGYTRQRQVRRAAMLLGVPLTCVSIVLAGFVDSYGLLLAVVIAGSLGTAMYHPEASARAHAASSSGNKGRGMSLFVLSGSFGFTSGAMIFGPLLAHFGLAAVVVLLLPGLLVPLFLASHLSEDGPAPTGPPAPRRGFRAVAKLMTLPMTVAALRQWAAAGAMMLVPLYFTNYLHRPLSVGGWMVFALQLGGDCGILTCGLVGARLGYKRAAIAGLAVASPLLLLFPFTSGLVTATLLFFTGAALAIPVLGLTLIGQDLLHDNRALATALTLGVGMGMGGVGSGVLGGVADGWGMPTALLLVGIMPLVTAVLALLLPDTRHVAE